MHVIEEEAGPFLEVGLKLKGRRYREDSLHVRKEKFF